MRTRNRTAGLAIVALVSLPIGACGGASPGVVTPPPAELPLATTSVAAPGFASAITDARTRLRAASRQTVGLAVAVYDDGVPVWEEAIGYQDIASGTPADARTTRFRIYSVIKPMTAAAALRLAENGALDPQAPIQRYLPSYPGQAAPITALQLGTHTAGIRHYANEAEARSTLHCEAVEDALPIFADDPLVHPPGEGPTYSSWGFVLLSAVVSAASGSSFPDALRTLVFEPAGMAGPVLDDPTRDVASRATPYVADGEGRRQADTVDNTCKWGAGGFVATAADVARFGSALLGGELVSDRSREMFLRGEDVYSAQGSGVGGTALLRIDAANGLAISLLSNTSGEAVSAELRDALTDIHRAFAGAVAAADSE